MLDFWYQFFLIHKFKFFSCFNEQMKFEATVGDHAIQRPAPVL